MGENEELSAELKAFEAELAALVPEDERLDRARLLFAAGQASARRRMKSVTRRLCAALAAASTVALALLVVLLVRPGPQVKIVRQIVYVASPESEVDRPMENNGPGDSMPAANEPTDAPASPLRSPMSEKPGLLATMLWGVRDNHAGPIHRAGVGGLLGDWNLFDDRDRRPQPAVSRDTPPPPMPEPKTPKTYRVLLEEMSETAHGRG